ncbi:hypothetical protein, partial [Aeromonas caviae]|uniref:hypothetical protein n=1 Tax=Aeromonas caviae TaxID=648 RepID=UPI001CC54465
GVGFCLGEGQEIDWIGHTEYSETRIEQLDHIFNLIGIKGIRAKLWIGKDNYAFEGEEHAD